MTFHVSQTLARAAALSAFMMSATLLGLNPAHAAGEEQPAAAPAADGAETAPAEAAPAEEAAPASDAAAPAEEAAPAAAEAPAAEEAPAAAEAPAVSDTAPAAAAGVDLQDLVVGSPVLASDGVKIGEVNRVNSDANGNVTEIHVTDGGPAGLGVAVRAIPVGQITSGGKEVKVSISAADAAKLPIIGGDKG